MIYILYFIPQNPAPPPPAQHNVLPTPLRTNPHLIYVPTPQNANIVAQCRSYQKNICEESQPIPKISRGDKIRR